MNHAVKTIKGVPMLREMKNQIKIEVHNWLGTGINPFMKVKEQKTRLLEECDKNLIRKYPFEYRGFAASTLLKKIDYYISKGY